MVGGSVSSPARRRLDELGAKLAAAQNGEQRDVIILRSMPGLWRAAAGAPLRRGDNHALRMSSGATPVTRRSGKLRTVVRRWTCNKRRENAIDRWARAATAPHFALAHWGPLAPSAPWN
jgi:hypothetical protein